jgi:inner membrane protein
MEFFQETSQVLMTVGVLMAVVDIVILGFATFFLTLIGLAVLTTGVMLHFGVISDSMTTLALCIAVLSAVYSLLLWKPLSNLQKEPEIKNVTSDLIGHQFVLTGTVSTTEKCAYHFSGIDWNVEADSELAEGTRVEVIDVQVGLMRVKAVEDVQS